MFKFKRTIFTFLLVFGLTATLMGNEWADTYFPNKIGSSWVYVNEDGDEITRYAVEGEEIDGTTYRAFTYEPAIDDWEKYQYAVHPYLYQVGEEWITFLVGDEIEQATKSILEKKLDEAVVLMQEQIAGQLPPEVTIDFDFDVDPQAQDLFYLFPIPIAYNEEWVAMHLDIKVDMTMDVQGAPTELPEELKTITSNTSIEETGVILGTESVETEAGTFDDCLIIEYKTKTTTETDLPPEIQQMIPEQQTNEATTTLWLAPNVGIVKFRSENENTDDVATLELTNYEIIPDESESEEKE
ncbi:MAG: hypothetical protein OXD54_11110 [Candidatus Poribacteria bacterium]|nr:hypothetical protein [Candidatus Poribacteria bacterium]